MKFSLCESEVALCAVKFLPRAKVKFSALAESEVASQ